MARRRTQPVDIDLDAKPKTRKSPHRKRGRPQRKDLIGAEEKALQYRLQGMTLVEIAKKLYCSGPHVLHLYNRAIERRRPLLDKQFKEYVDEQLLQIETLYEVHFKLRKNPRSAELLIKLLDRKSKLLGLDRPSKVQVIPPPPPSELEFDPSLLPTHELLELRRIVALAQEIKARQQLAIEGHASEVAPDGTALLTHEETV